MRLLRVVFNENAAKTSSSPSSSSLSSSSASAWNIFLVSWFELLRNRKFNYSLMSLIFGASCIGMTIGWQENFLMHYVITSCSNGICINMQKFKSTLHLVINLGACLGALIPLCLVDVIGRRSHFAIAAILDITCWFSLTAAVNNPFVFIGAAIGGLATGSFIVTATMYIGELSPAQSRSTSAALVAFSVYVGILFSTSLSLFIYNRIAPLTMSLVALGFLFSVYHWMIESPFYLYEHGEVEKSKEALRSLRATSSALEIESEFKSMEISFSSTNEFSYNSFSLTSIFFPKKTTQGFVLILLLIVSQTIGGYVMDDYTEKYFQKSLPPYGKIILTFLDVLSIGLCIYLIERIGRRLLLIISVSGMSICCLILSIYSLIHETKWIKMSLETNEIFTSVIVILYCIAYSLGLTPILPLLTGEEFPNRIKTIIMGSCISLIYLGAIINQTVFELLDTHKGAYIATIAFSVIGSFGLFSLNFFISESSMIFYEIQNEMNDLNVFGP